MNAKTNRRTLKYPGTIILMSFLAMLVVYPASALVIEEYKLKAAFVFNFLKFVEWPAEKSSGNDDEVKICILGHSPLDAEVIGLGGKAMGGKKLVVTRIQPQDSGRCSALYIPGSEKTHLAGILTGLEGLGVLTIGDTEGFAEKGVIINMYVEDERVRFEVNKDAAARAGLRIDARLLRLAKIVKDRN